MCHCDRFKVEIVDIKRRSWMENFRSEQEDLPLINIRPRVLSSYWQYPDKTYSERSGALGRRENVSRVMRSNAGQTELPAVSCPLSSRGGSV